VQLGGRIRCRRRGVRKKRVRASIRLMFVSGFNRSSIGPAFNVPSKPVLCRCIFGILWIAERCRGDRAAKPSVGGRRGCDRRTIVRATEAVAAVPGHKHGGSVMPEKVREETQASSLLQGSYVGLVIAQ
jgi:hypothetical protein